MIILKQLSDIKEKNGRRYDQAYGRKVRIEQTKINKATTKVNLQKFNKWRK